MTQIIQPILLDDVCQYIDNLVDHGLVNVEGTQVQYPIFNTVIENQSVRKYIYLDEHEQVGKNILGASLLDTSGNILATQTLNVTKNDVGFFICFEIPVRLEVS
ncbi:hypothetical protein [Aneurinibacillus terranovensis]|uniref:hypothetical protein n=1 Tax=Aneurinibacillus terranovensis TaxID=278991 RepID=UPI0004190FC5|nr:hypothetical protein [Aneurinibacillus terranovensis]